MTTISDTLIGPDGSADWDEGSTIRFEADAPRDAGGKILTTRPEPVPVNTDGTFSATLQPGRYTVRVRSGNNLREQMGPWPILVPATGTSRLWPLIAVAVGQSPDISYQRLLAAVQAYLEANPIEGGGGGGLTEQQIAEAATTPGAPIKTALDTTYVPVPASGGTAGQVLAKTSTGTAWVAPPTGGGGASLTKDATTGMYVIGSGSSLTKDATTGMYPIGA